MDYYRGSRGKYRVSRSGLLKAEQYIVYIRGSRSECRENRTEYMSRKSDYKWTLTESEGDSVGAVGVSRKV